MDLVSRLKSYLDYRQVSITQFADECGIPRPTGSQLLAGRNKKVSDEIIGKIHAAYPDLNIVWLMFGEGDMTSDANIKTSEPQNRPFPTVGTAQPSNNQQLDFGLPFTEEIIGNEPKKIPLGNDAVNTETTTFTFTPQPANPTLETVDQVETKQQTQQHLESDISDKKITLTPGKGKRVTGIVVYYDDCTYESFIPDPNHGHPFMR